MPDVMNYNEEDEEENERNDMNNKDSNIEVGKDNPRTTGREQGRDDIKPNIIRKGIKIPNLMLPMSPLTKLNTRMAESVPNSGRRISKLSMLLQPLSPLIKGNNNRMAESVPTSGRRINKEPRLLQPIKPLLTKRNSKVVPETVPSVVPTSTSIRKTSNELKLLQPIIPLRKVLPFIPRMAESLPTSPGGRKSLTELRLLQPITPFVPFNRPIHPSTPQNNISPSPYKKNEEQTSFPRIINPNNRIMGNSNSNLPSESNITRKQKKFKSSSIFSGNNPASSFLSSSNVYSLPLAAGRMIGRMFMKKRPSTNVNIMDKCYLRLEIIDGGRYDKGSNKDSTILLKFDNNLSY